MSKIPKNHPRYFSLITRKKISNAMKKGIVHETGLIAHGRGEAFDYLIGEKTIKIAEDAEKVAAAMILCAENPVISVNGNVVALAAKQCIDLSKAVPAKIEVNLFHRTKQRVKKIAKELKKMGAEKIYGIDADCHIPGLKHDRGLCDKHGIFAADVVLVPLEDGDRCEALVNMGKTVIAIDLNPLSRTARYAHVTIVDNVVRAVPNIEKWVEKLKNENKVVLEKIIKAWDNKKMLKDTCCFISKRLNSLF
ncbi:MAG: 4-phosphopantoate--beta-alanine ligase [Candidatus Thermoplasmatota archaeon]|jgi:4-phosphopantoate--beta-alanine ligase|nr:4-phosphopantoate--beta-alanine ligase [Candidatus Thermoplasmatota archaeon]